MGPELQQTGLMVLEVLIRGIGALWVFGAVMVWISVRREAALDGMIGKLEAMNREFGDEGGGEPAARNPDDAWEDRDDRRRRFWLVMQGGLLLVTGTAMLLLHWSASWLIAALIAAQGLYFIWREGEVRRAPTKEIAERTQPSPSTVNAAWFSLAAGSLVWMAAGAGRLH